MNLKIFTENIEAQAYEQIHTLMRQQAFKDAKVRIMPDVHAGAGCVVGFTADLGDKVIPNVVGVDIGCGMLTVYLGNVQLDLELLDKVIRKVVPAGFDVHECAQEELALGLERKLNCYHLLRNVVHIEKSLGTLGGGNHFIEVDVNNDGDKFLIIHTGSRNLGKQVAEIYQDMAITKLNRVSEDARQAVIKALKAQGRQSEIPEALKMLTPSVTIPDEIAYLEGIDREQYLHDMKICQLFASKNRKRIADNILNALGLSYISRFETVHNYIGDDNIVRKGAISAKKDQVVLIPLNMRDGCILGYGLGNDDWNNSAPHGAGRLMSRGDAKRTLSVDEYKEQMQGIYSTTVGIATLDEAPGAYKDMEDILKYIGPTVKVIDILKPIYNFKAADQRKGKD